MTPLAMGGGWVDCPALVRIPKGHSLPWNGPR